MEVVLPEPVDYIVGELMSIYCANEFQVQIFKNLRQYLKPNGKLLPEYITNVIQLGEADFDVNYKHYPINFTRHLPEQLSLQQVVNVIDLYQIEKETVEKTLEITPILTGTVNCVYMHSFVQVAKGCNFTGTDSLMPPTVCRLETPVEVQQGQPIQLHIQFEYGTSLDEAKFWVEQ
jgi:predicted RNA methylase